MRLAALFWSDLNGPRLKEILARIRDGYRVLALDVKVRLFCVQNGIAHTCLESWLDAETLYRCAVTARSLQQTWFRDHREDFTIDGLCLPEVDGEAMTHFWRETVTAAVFVERFRTAGGRDLFVPRSEAVASVYYRRADPWKSVVEILMGGNRSGGDMERRVEAFAGDLHLSDSLFGDPRFDLGGAERRRGPERNRLTARDAFPSAADIAFALNPGEIGRFDPVIRRLQRQPWARVRVFLSSRDRGQCRELSRSRDLDLRPLSGDSRIPEELAGRLYAGYRRVRKAAAGRLGPSMEIDYHFRHYCHHRWPRLYADYQDWKGIWTAQPPDAVIVGSLADAESKLPAAAASHLGIETFSLPHARFFGIEHDPHCHRILYDFLPYRTAMERIGIAEDRMVGCRALLGAHPYPTHRRITVDRNALNILVLVGNVNGVVDDGELFVPRVLATAHLEALQALSDVPGPLRGKVDIRFKVHPLGAELAMFELAGIDVDRFLLPSDTDLTDALGDFDLVVDVNNTGTAVLNAIEREKPLLLWWNGLVKRVNYIVEVLTEAGEPVYDIQALWLCISRVLGEPEYRRSLEDRSKAFKARYLDTGNLPSIEAVMQTRLARKGRTNPSALLHRIAQAPDDVEALVDLALAEASDGRPGDALAFLEDALILAPTHSRALALKADIKKRPP